MLFVHQIGTAKLLASVNSSEAYWGKQFKISTAEVLSIKLLHYAG